MRDVHGLAAGRNEFRDRGSGRTQTLAEPGLNCDLFRNARAILAVEVGFCDLSNLTAIEAVRLIAKGELRAEEYALRLLERYRALKSLNVVTWMDEERVVESARKIDQLRARGEPLGALGGLPVIIKDTIDVGGTPAAAASAIFARNMRFTNAAQRLFDAGAVLFGTDPYDHRGTADGLSAGTAAAIAARLVPVGLGTDTIMARTVADVALVHAAITGTLQATSCDLRAIRIGVPAAPHWIGIDPETGRVARNALTHLQAAGVKLVDLDARTCCQAAAAHAATFAEHGLAAIVFPTQMQAHGPRALGAPSLSIPAGLTAQGLPVGLEFDALAGDDRELLALGLAVEQTWPKIPLPQPIG